ncbi:glycoside hydrolase family 25 protein [Oryzibacter oryziterrae]|uniref:glycoside hydrolase family 25 protein n=1 Tax=Oryzibacter oryziterrae TaxID=2766474 RepID=UPI001F42A353|nr:glycoside hydrolase family 25 protein [Oryzibacter oryziterrae]
MDLGKLKSFVAGWPLVGKFGRKSLRKGNVRRRKVPISRKIESVGRFDRLLMIAARLVNPLALGGVAIGMASCAFFDYEPPGPEDFPVKGIDVSYFQEDINWNAVRASNTAFAWIKATEGGDWSDEKFPENWYGSAAAGVARGAYHMWYFCRPASEQVAWFIQHVPYDATALPPVLDLEWTASKTCPKRPSRAELLPELNQWLTDIERFYGKRPVIYTSIAFYRERLAGAFPNHLIWIASYKGHPYYRAPNLKWQFWQHTENGRVPGIRGRVDRNVFYGSESEWEQFLAGQLAINDD